MKKKIFFIFISLLKLALFQELKKDTDLIDKAKKYGYDLRNPEDPFFHDICTTFKEIKKDITLEYRRKYYFFPKDKNSLIDKKLISQTPKRNSSNYCFKISNSFSSLFYNVAIIFFLPMFIIQFSFLLVCLLFRISDSITNTPQKKVEAQNKKKEKKTKKNYATTYSEFIPEVDRPKPNDTLQPIMATENNIENSNNEQNLSNKQFNNNNNDGNIKQNSLEQLNSKVVLMKNTDENSEPAKAVEKSIDNYTFGLKFGKGYNFSDQGGNKDEKPENNENKKKIEHYLYDQMNQKNEKENKAKIKNNNNINADTPIAISNTNNNMEKIYTREEYFYFGYLLARIQDKRTIFEIYIDLLEQCQIIFKFLHSPFNVYEDRKLQIVYYLMKINLYFLFNCLLIIKCSVINNIYDDKNNFINDMSRSFLSTIFTYGISLYIYYLTNIKKILIRRRYKMINMKINIPRINNEFSNFTKNLCIHFLFNKLLLLGVVLLIVFSYSFYVCFSFCNAYLNSQLLLLKCVLLSITFSLIIPFIVCWIPAFLRKLTMKRKKARYYDVLKIIESLFVPL